MPWLSPTVHYTPGPKLLRISDDEVSAKWCPKCKRRTVHAWALYGGQAWYEDEWLLRCKRCLVEAASPD
jgi:hypothetical protein